MNQSVVVLALIGVGQFGIHIAPETLAISVESESDIDTLVCAIGEEEWNFLDGRAGGELAGGAAKVQLRDGTGSANSDVPARIDGHSVSWLMPS